MERKEMHIGSRGSDLDFFFSFENSHFPRIDRDWVKVMLEVGEMDVCRDFFCARICSSPYVVFFLFFYYFFFRGIFYIGFHVSTMAKIEIPQ